MAKMESTLKNMVMSLTVIALIASSLLAGGYVLTKEPIDKATQAKKDNAIKEVLPDKTAEIGRAVEIKLDGFEDVDLPWLLKYSNSDSGAQPNLF